MSTFLTFLASGLAVGASFALIGSGFVVVHRVTHIVNFTQGTLTVLGGLVSYSLLSMAIPHGLGEIGAVLVSAAAGLLVGLVTLSRPGTPAFVALLITLGLSFLGTAIIILFWGQNPISPPGLPGTVDVAGVGGDRVEELDRSARANPEQVAVARTPGHDEVEMVLKVASHARHFVADRDGMPR